MSLALTNPSSLAEVDTQCEQVEAWAATCDSVPALRDTANKLAAITEYLNRSSIEGRARVDAAMRRLEARIGELEPEPMTRAQAGGTRRGGPDRDPDLLSEKQRTEFRLMAAHPEVVEEVIAESTDADPPSRRKVIARVRAKVNKQAEKRDAADLKDALNRAGLEPVRHKRVELERLQERRRVMGALIGVSQRILNELAAAYTPAELVAAHGDADIWRSVIDADVIPAAEWLAALAATGKATR